MEGHPLEQLHALGQSFWLDNIRREWVNEGLLSEMVKTRGLRGLTSNPAILHGAITTSEAYDEDIQTLSHAGRSALEIYEQLAISDIRGAADALRPVWDSSEGADGYASLEVSPTLAHDTQGTIEEARRLFAEVDRPNVMIKVPGTRAGNAAIEVLIADGIPINVTLLFSTTQYSESAFAYLRGLERREAASKDLKVASVASVFMSRIDSYVDHVLSDRILPGRDTSACKLMGRAAVSSARSTYARFKEIFGGERFGKLADGGALKQRPLWASTSTKNPLYRDVLYVESLIGVDTVNTLPDKTADAFQDHGEANPRTLEISVDKAYGVLSALNSLGVDFDGLCHHLQEEGIAKFVVPFRKLIASVEVKRLKALGEEREKPYEITPTLLSEPAVKAGAGQVAPLQLMARLWRGDPSLAREGEAADPSWLLDERFAKLAASLDNAQSLTKERQVFVVASRLFGLATRSLSGSSLIPHQRIEDPKALENAIEGPSLVLLVDEGAGETAIAAYKALHNHKNIKFAAMVRARSPLSEVIPKDQILCTIEGAPLASWSAALSPYAFATAVTLGADLKALSQRLQEVVLDLELTLPALSLGGFPGQNPLFALGMALRHQGGFKLVGDDHLAEWWSQLCPAGEGAAQLTLGNTLAPGAIHLYLNPTKALLFLTLAHGLERALGAAQAQLQNPPT